MTGHDAYAAVAARTLVNPDGDRLLLLLHGLGGDRAQAFGLIDGSPDARLAVLAPDLRAHGDTPVIGGRDAFTFDALVADILALLDRLGQQRKPAYAAGISMGAALALRLALDGRLDLRGMALVRPAFDASPGPPNLAVLPVIAALLQAGDAESARRALLASPEYQAIASVSAAGAKSALDQVDKPHARERAIRLVEVPGNVAWRDGGDLAQVQVPTLVIGADRDPMHPIAMARRTAKLLPNARIIEVTPRDADPERYDREIRETVREHIAGVIG